MLDRDTHVCGRALPLALDELEGPFGVDTWATP